jgi:hypothetical protein
VLIFTSVIPWYFTTQTTSDGQYSIINSYYVPLLFYTVGTSGSAAIPYPPAEQSILVLSSIFFWGPLFLIASRIRTSNYEATNVEFGLPILLIVFLNEVFGFGFLEISSNHLPGPGLIIAFLTLVFWYVGVLWRSLRRDKPRDLSDSSVEPFDIHD